MKRALITGITGQDGSFLSELLLEKGYEVHGIVRKVALEDPQHHLWRIRHILEKIHVHAASMESFASLFRVVAEVKPDECYHLAAQSFVSYSFDQYQYEWHALHPIRAEGYGARMQDIFRGFERNVRQYG